MTVRIGPAGWSYKDWEGIVYPAPKPRDFDPHIYLAGYFDAVEVNSTFYRPATDTAARAWVDRAAAGERARDRFRFTAKLWQRCTRATRPGLPFGKVARATCAVWSGTTYVRFASRDIAHLRLASGRPRHSRCSEAVGQFCRRTL